MVRERIPLLKGTSLKRVPPSLPSGVKLQLAAADTYSEIPVSRASLFVSSPSVPRGWRGPFAWLNALL